jgi:hypothetical protein
MFRLNRALLALSLALVLLAGVASAFAQDPAAQPASKPVWVDPIRGVADIEYISPTKANGLIKLDPKDANIIVTTIKVKNTSAKAIARLTVEEFWYDAKGNPVTGDKTFLKKPLMPGAEDVLVLHTPKLPAMNSNKYVFSHANGTVKVKGVAKF